MAPTIILAINAGSSSVKVSVFSHEGSSKEPTQLAEIQITGLTAPPAEQKYTVGKNKPQTTKVEKITGPQDAYQKILETLVSDSNLPQISSPDSITFACHRIVHGGDYSAPITINREAYHHLEELSDLAPLHNAGALDIVRAVHSSGEKITNVAFFDSAFHSTLPLATRTYAIDPQKAKQNKLRKYGFHGLSYAFITRAVAEFFGKKTEDTNLIALHLGSGASACAIKGGESVDTTMGLTPLSGLPGATRSGDVDASLIFHFTHDAGRPAASSSKDLHLSRAEEILNKESGWKALTGTTDFGEISSKAEKGDEKCKLAFEIFVDRLVGYVGSYFVKLEGRVDALVFAGGMGEKGGALREEVVKRLGCLGFVLDQGKNGKPADETVADVGKLGGTPRVLVCQTDEQTEMARQCALKADELLKK